MKSAYFYLFLIFCISELNAQLQPGSKVFLRFENTKNEVNVNGQDAIEMLKSYLTGKTTLVIVDSEQSANFIFQLRIIEKAMGNRMGKLDVVNSQTGEAILESKWARGTVNAFYGYSSSRHSIGRLVKDQLLHKFPNIERI